MSLGKRFVAIACVRVKRLPSTSVQRMWMAVRKTRHGLYEIGLLSTSKCLLSSEVLLLGCE